MASNLLNNTETNLNNLFEIEEDVEFKSSSISATQSVAIHNIATVDVTIIQSEGQTVFVKINGNETISQSSCVAKGASFSVYVKANEGYVAGTPNIESGVFDKNYTFYATPASLKPIEVTIEQPTKNQRFEVITNRGTYNSSFTAYYGDSYTVRVIPDEGFQGGTCSYMSGTIIKPIAFKITEAERLPCRVNITQSPYQIITVATNRGIYTSSFDAYFGDVLNVSAVSDLGYDCGELSITTKTIDSNDPVNVTVTPATIHEFDITINQVEGSQSISVIVDEVEHTESFKCKYGSNYVCNVVSDNGINEVISGIINSDIIFDAELIINPRRVLINNADFKKQTVYYTVNGQLNKCNDSRTFMVPYGSSLKIDVIGGKETFTNSTKQTTINYIPDPETSHLEFESITEDTVIDIKEPIVSTSCRLYDIGKRHKPKMLRNTYAIVNNQEYMKKYALGYTELSEKYRASVFPQFVKDASFTYVYIINSKLCDSHYMHVSCAGDDHNGISLGENMSVLQNWPTPSTDQISPDSDLITDVHFIYPKQHVNDQLEIYAEVSKNNESNRYKFECSNVMFIADTLILHKNMTWTETADLNPSGKLLKCFVAKIPNDKINFIENEDNPCRSYFDMMIEVKRKKQ